MTRQFSKSALTCAVVLGILATAPIAAFAQDAPAPLTIASAKVSLAGTSNIHEFTASSTEVRVTRVALANGVSGAGLLAAALNPGAVEAFEIAIRTTSLAATRDGIDKNMHKALKADQFKDITFRLLRLDARPALRAVGILKIAGVEREITIGLKTAATATALTITGEVPLLMTDYGIAPPKAMLGMLKTDPKITVTFEVILAAPAALTR
jgi:polyisoprenoid-binding protein YceI